MRRFAAISGRTVGSSALWMGRTHVAPGTRSADHHHGESETAIHVLRGHPVFVFLEDGVERRLETRPGDFVFVPPWTPHREENPHPAEEAVVVIARSTQEAVVVDLPSLAQTRDQLSDGSAGKVANRFSGARDGAAPAATASGVCASNRSSALPRSTHHAPCASSRSSCPGDHPECPANTRSRLA